MVDTLFVAARPVVRQPRAGDETGSSLIELAVVIVIMAVLMIIATPTLLGSRHRASDRGAQAILRHVLLAENAAYTQRQAYTDDITPSGLPSMEGSVRYGGDVDPAATGTVYVDVSTANVLTLGSRSSSGSCFYVQETPGNGNVGYLIDATCPRPSEATNFGRSW